ncbi:hypothetical protein [Burkholderia paludis]|uniref:hypothetical protein n=1 Tax=Burkholderia paludis TaxID=1506587 RepID=UPI00126A4994|nr:hypothetical protein [Burkholderia paludis]
MKIVTVTLLVDARTDQDTYDAVNELLRPITHPCGSGSSDNSLLIDYSVGEARHAKDSTIVEFLRGQYVEGTFQS